MHQNRYEEPRLHRLTPLLSAAIFHLFAPQAHPLLAMPGTTDFIPSTLSAPARSRTGSVASGTYVERHRRVVRCLSRSGSFLGASHKGWQGQMDSNHRIRESNSRALPLGHIPVSPGHFSFARQKVGCSTRRRLATYTVSFSGMSKAP